MRTFQVVMFVLGIVSFLAAVPFVGQDMGNTLWRAGVAIMLIDLVCAKLWPGTKAT